RIQNPLHGIPKDKLLSQVEDFAKEKGMEDITPLLQKGALIAQNASQFESIPELDEEDKAVIRRETTHKWSQPRDLYFTVILCSIAAAVQGWDQTGSNGANLSFPIEFGISETDPDPNAASRNQWIVGVINAGPYISSCLIGCWLTDPLNYLLGRRGTIFIAGIFCTLTVIGSACAQTWPQLFVTRLLLGIGMGAKASTVPVYAAENTPASIRGGLVMSWQYMSIVKLHRIPASLIWEDPGKSLYRLHAIPDRIQHFSAIRPDAKRALAPVSRLKARSQTSDKELAGPGGRILEFAIISGSTYISRFMELFTVPRLRRATLASWVVMIAQQMCGINIIAFYSSSVFVDAGYSPKSALLASFGYGLVNWLFAFPAVWTIDTFGRRNLLLFTFPNMAWTLLAAGFCFFIPSTNSARIPLIALFVFMFAAFYSPGEGPVPFTYSAEVFPLTHREMGMAWAVATNLFWAAVLSLTFPRMKTALTPTGAFGFYAALNMVAFVMIFLLLPETKQRTLEELDYVFAVPTSKHMNYQVTKFLPYWIKRWILFKKDAKLEPLYDFSEVESVTVFEKGVGH
ncbi:Putative polyol transporter 1, partial [Leucoagaricus sp. SymC.cos]